MKRFFYITPAHRVIMRREKDQVVRREPDLFNIDSNLGLVKLESAIPDSLIWVYGFTKRTRGVQRIQNNIWQ